MPEIFKSEIKVRFGHCDPAGIVYHPQYYYILNYLVEDFVEECLGWKFKYPDMNIGMPIVGIRTEFTEPARVGDILEANLWVEYLGEKSVRFAITLKDKVTGRLKLKCVETAAFVSMEPIAPVAIPQKDRENLKRYLKDESIGDLTFRT